MPDSKLPSAPRHRRHISGWALLLATAAIVAVLVFLIRAPDPPTPPVGPGGWLTGTDNEKFDQLARQHGDFGDAMLEIAQRYRELAWAGSVRDWEYARYQLTKIEEVLALALERRPEYKTSARIFIEEGVSPLRTALADDPPEAFQTTFSQFTASCTQCHVRENAPLQDLDRWAAIPRPAPGISAE